MDVAVGNLWLVWLATFTLQPMAHTNHKFPDATATGVPCEVKSCPLQSATPIQTTRMLVGEGRGGGGGQTVE